MSVCASGLLLYNDIANLVESIVYSFGTKIKIPGMTHQDIAQEIRFECFRAIEKYDPTRIGPSPYNYLITCVQNKTYNLRRGTYVPNNPPCVRCELWDKKNKTCKINEENCDAIKQYRNGMKTKAAIKNPSEFQELSHPNSNNTYTEDKLLNDDIKSILPEYLIEDYNNLINGHADIVSPKNKKEIRRIVSEFLNE